MRISRSISVVVAALGCCLALSGTAFADATVSTTVGPVAIPSVPLSVCITAPGVNKCVPTVAVKSVTLKVTATAMTPAVTPPTITKIPCPTGTSGAAAQISTGSSSVTVGGSVTATLAPLPPLTVPLVPTVAPPNKTVTVYACTGTA